MSRAESRSPADELELPPALLAARPDLAAELAVAWQLARRAGRILLAGRHGLLTVSTKSTGTDVVTQMDTRSEDFIVAGLRERFPEDAVLGEEGGRRPGSSGATWVLDPLDGTVNYLYGLPGWAVSVARLRDGVAEVAVVDGPVYGETFVAVRGGGSHLVTAAGSQRLVPNELTDLRQALVATGFGYAQHRRAAQARTLAVVLPAVRDIRRAGAAALDLCWLAAGRADAYYERGLQPWDHAAAALIAEEAGLAVGGRLGEGPSSELAWAAVRGIAGPFLQLILTAGADRDG